MIMRTVAFRILTALCCLSMVATLFMVFFQAPVEASMGIVQKIFYFHVPSAYCMYLGWGMCTFSSVMFLARRKEHWDTLAKTGAELALLFATAVMITGPLWGRKSWGAYWTWDPRLTSSLLLTLIIVSYVLLRNLSSGEVERRFSAALAILGACVVPIIHISVSRWRGQHPSVLGAEGGGLADEMKPPFIMALLAFTILFTTFAWRRFELEKSRKDLERLEQTALAQGVLKGEEG